MSLQTYHGGCHCGAVRYAVDLDLSQPTIRCNCSLCRKSRAWFAFAPAASFRLESSGSALAEYRWAPAGKPEPNVTYHFCSRCGVRTHASGTAPDGRRNVAIQVATLEDATDRDQLAENILYVDGLHDRFDRPPDEELKAL